MSCISRPRPRHGAARFNNALAAWAGGYCPVSPNYTATALELNVAWFASPPPNASSPSVDGAIARIAIDPQSDWCFCCPAGVFRQGSVPPGSWITVARFECVDSRSGVASSSFDEPTLVGDDWVLAFNRGGGASVCPWSVDTDLDIDLEDLALFLSSFGACAGQPGFVLRADQDHSGCVDLADLAIILAHFGRLCC